jgi:hypothetical protein
MLHVLRVGCPWRDIHERYGKWNSVYVRFRRWAEQGVWDALLQTLVDLGLTDDWQHMIDSTMVRGHVSAPGGKGGAVRTLLVDHAADRGPSPHSPRTRALCRGGVPHHAQFHAEMCKWRLHQCRQGSATPQMRHRTPSGAYDTHPQLFNHFSSFRAAIPSHTLLKNKRPLPRPWLQVNRRSPFLANWRDYCTS